MKKVLILDDSDLRHSVREIAERIGCEVLSLEKADFIEQVIQRHGINLLVLAKEMRIAGPDHKQLAKLRYTNPVRMREMIKEAGPLKVDFEFGKKIFERLSAQGIFLPTIFLTTNDLDQPFMHFSNDGKLQYAEICKCQRYVFDHIRSALARGLGLPEDLGREADF